MPSVINKRYIQSNLAFGLANEHSLTPFVKSHFCPSLERAPSEYSNFDFLGDNIVVELKTRKGDYIKKGFPTFPFDTPKLEKFCELKSSNPLLKAYVIWHWIDMGVIHTWEMIPTRAEDNDVEYYLKNWVVDGKRKSVVEVFRECTECIKL